MKRLAVHRSMPISFCFFRPLSVRVCDSGESEVCGVGGGHQRWLQHKTAGSGHRVAGLNLPPGNPFRGQVCLLKESQSSRFGVSFFVFSERGGHPRHSRNELSALVNCNLSHFLAGRVGPGLKVLSLCWFVSPYFG